MHAKHQWERSGDGTAFTLHVTYNWIRWGTELNLDFWEDGNTILVPGGAGGWKEVTP